MDFFARLLRRQPTDQRAPTGTTPQQRFKQFKAVYNKLLSIWNNGQGASKDAFSAENHRLRIVQIRELLANDARGPTPHLCLSFAFTNGVLRTLTQIGTAFCETGIASEVIGVLQLVVDSEEEAFLEDRGLADALPIFVEAVKKDLLGRVWSLKEEQTEGALNKDGGLEARMVEVLFGVTSAIKARPLVLKAWFRPEQFFDDADQLTEDDRPSRIEEFPLFYALIPYLTQEGRAGDFARMGILYIVESTSYSPPLERWLVEGDMAALVTSVLGALFSQLSTKLALTYNDEETPAVLKFSSRSEQELPYDVEATSSKDYADHISSFLANLMFWQDILEHCTSREVKQTLLDHFQFIFLQKLLYPSLLGSSKAGSVAVLTYLRSILESIDHYDLIHRMLVYLFGLPITIQSSEEPATPIAKARRRKSEILLVKHAAHDDEPTPELFNLSDLITDGLKAADRDTTTCTLRLLSTLLRRHHQESLPFLLKTRRARLSDLVRTYGGHQKELDNWITLAENLTAFQDLEQSYERAIHDSKNHLELHICTYPLMQVQTPEIDKLDRYSTIEPYVLLPGDPVSVSLLRLLDTFLTNDIETNLSLTQVFIDLTSCGNMRLEGWLLTEPSAYVYQGMEPASKIQVEQAPKADAAPAEPVDEDVAIDDGSDDEETDANNPKKEETGDTKGDEENDEDSNRSLDTDRSEARQEPAWQAENSSPVFRSLDKLLNKVESFHQQLQDFDVLLAECKKEIIPEAAPAPSSTTAMPVAPQTSRDQSLLHTNASPGVASSQSSLRSSPAITATTPQRGHGHGRTSSIADRFASVFGSSPGKPVPGLVGSRPAATPASRLRLKLSEASRVKTANGRPRSDSLEGDVSPISPDSQGQINPLPKGHSRNVSLQESIPETPSKPSYLKQRALRGDDLGASPSPRLDRRVVPGSAREKELGSSLRQAIGSDSDSDSISDVGSAGSIDEEQLVSRKDGSDTEEAGRSGDQTEDEDAFGQSSKGQDIDVTVGHLLTNVIILQEFVLEMAALVSVRASYFGEVRFR